MPNFPTAEDIVLVFPWNRLKSNPQAALNNTKNKIDMSWIKSIIGLMRAGSAKGVNAKT